MKLPIYARAGISEVWVVDVQRRLVDVHRGPVEGRYTEVSTKQAGDSLSLFLAPEISLQVEQVVG